MLDILTFGNVTNLCDMVDRIKNEAETTEEMAIMLNAEIFAYQQLLNEKKPYYIEMYDTVKEFPNADYVSVGRLYESEEDFDDDIGAEIIPYSHMKNGNYSVSYSLIWKM